MERTSSLGPFTYGARERRGKELTVGRDWDLWGPLVICLSLAIVLSIDVSYVPLSTVNGHDWADEQSPPEQSMQVFSLVISLVTIGSVVVTVNSKLLGGKV